MNMLRALLNSRLFWVFMVTWACIHIARVVITGIVDVVPPHIPDGLIQISLEMYLVCLVGGSFMLILYSPTGDVALDFLLAYERGQYLAVTLLGLFFLPFLVIWIPLFFLTEYGVFPLFELLRASFYGDGER